MTTTTATAPRFISRDARHGECTRCGRELGVRYLLEVDGQTESMGRGCAASTMGWATSAVEMQAKQIERKAIVAARRAALTDTFPALPAGWIAEIVVTDYLWPEGWRSLAAQVA